MKIIIKVIATILSYKLCMNLLKYWITATLPDSIEYPEDDPYYHKGQRYHDNN